VLARLLNHALANLPALALAGIALLLLLWAVLCTLDHRPRRLCPGPRSQRWRRVLPDRWLWTPCRCGYDLSGLAFRAPGVLPVGVEHLGELTCPECGCALSHPSQLLRGIRRFRPVPLGAMLALLAFHLYHRGPLRAWGWLEYTPTLALVETETTLHERTPEPVLNEVSTRVYTKALSASQELRLIPSLVRDLRHDDIRGNAERAMSLLRQIGFAALPALHEALRSEDYQQRQLAAHLVRELDPEPPSADLLAATFEGLRDDWNFLHESPKPGRRYRDWIPIENAREGLAFLSRSAASMDDLLKAGLHSEDAQQRLMCAVLVSWKGRTRLLPIACAVLTMELDGGLHDRIAACALERAGADAIPYLEPLQTDPNPARRDVAHQILLDLTRPLAPSDPADAPQDGIGIRIRRRLGLPLQMTLWPDEIARWDR